MWVKIKEYYTNVIQITEVKDVEKKDGKFWVTLEMNNGSIKGYSFDTREEAEKTIKRIVFPCGIV